MNQIKKVIAGMSVLAVFAVITAFSTNTPGTDATAWQIDRAHSNISFEVAHFFTPVTGRFHEYDSEIYFDPENLEESRVNVTIMVNSVDTNNDRRDNDLRSDNFFNVEKFPTITFVSDEIAQTGENEYVAKGKLTIKDVTKDIELSFSLLGIQDHPMREGVRIAGIKASQSINRTDFKVGVGNWAATAVVRDRVDIRIALELNSVS